MEKKTRSLKASNEKSTRIAAAVFLFPVLLILAVFIFYPILDTFRISTLDWNGISADTKFIGFDNWRKLSTDFKFWKPLSIT